MVSTSPQVREALRRVRAWYTQAGSGPIGRAKWEAVRDTPKKLKQAPYSGGVAPGLPDARQIVVAEHCFIHDIDPDTGLTATAGNVRILLLPGPGQP